MVDKYTALVESVKLVTDDFSAYLRYREKTQAGITGKLNDLTDQVAKLRKLVETLDPRDLEARMTELENRLEEIQNSLQKT